MDAQLFEAYPDLLTASDVAEITRQAATTVRRLMANGDIPACKIGVRWYVPKKRFIEFVEEGVSDE